MDSKYPDFEHKYDDDVKLPVWTAHINGTYKGPTPPPGSAVEIVLIEESTGLPKEGNFWAEEQEGEITLYRLIDNGGAKVKWHETTILVGGSFASVWNRQFVDHKNTEVLDNMMSEWRNNEEYVEIELEEEKTNNKKSQSDKKSGKNSGKKNSKRKVLVRKVRVRTVKDKFYVTKGPIQGGKSEFMMDGALKCLKDKRSSIIIFEETGHLIQFKERLTQTIDSIMKNIRESSGKDCEIPLTYVVAKDEDFSADEFLESLRGKPAKIFLIIGNDKQVGLLNDRFRSASTMVRNEIMESYVLWIDEADHVDSGTAAKKTASLSLLKEYAYSIVEVSATVLDITSREDVKPEHLKRLKAPERYRGIPSFLIEETKEKAKYASKVDANLFRTDKSLKRIIREFMHETPTECRAYRDSHPCIMLINNGKTIEPQKKLMADMMRKNYDMVIMVYIGDGLHIHHSELSSRPFEINGIRSSLTKCGHLFKGISPSAALLWLKRNGGVHKFHHILIASGNLAGRSISYGCKDDGAQGLPFWHLTHHRLVLPKGAACPSVIQKCRLCTVFETPVPLKLYVNKEDEKAVIKSYWSQEEIIERSKNNPNQEYLREIMSRLEMLGGKNGKIPKGRTLTIDKKLKVCQRVKGDDGGLPMSAYEFGGPDHVQKPISEMMVEADIERKNEQKELHVPVAGWIGIRAPPEEEKQWREIYSDIVDYLKNRPNTPIGRGEIRRQCSALTDRRQLITFQKKFATSGSVTGNLVFRNIGSEISPKYEYMYQV